jgi:hypothetical protein
VQAMPDVLKIPALSTDHVPFPDMPNSAYEAYFHGHRESQTPETQIPADNRLWQKLLGLGNFNRIFSAFTQADRNING